MKYAYAGDRQLSCDILSFIMDKGYRPEILLVSSKTKNSHAEDLIKISGLEKDKIFWGTEFKSISAQKQLVKHNLDYIIGIHFPYIIPNEILEIPKVGFINLHPAYLPYNKGWHTPSWAIIENTMYGATLHFMAEELDGGDIIHQKELKVDISDTANSLYQKVLDIEKEVFDEAFDDLLTLNPKRIKQSGIGTSHQKKDLDIKKEIKLEENINALDLINKIRALTTNKVDEASFFYWNDQKYSLQIHIKKIDE